MGQFRMDFSFCPIKIYVKNTKAKNIYVIITKNKKGGRDVKTRKDNQRLSIR